MNPKTSGNQDASGNQGDATIDPRSAKAGPDPEREGVASEDDSQADYGADASRDASEDAGPPDDSGDAPRSAVAGAASREDGASGDVSPETTGEAGEDLEREISRLNDRHLRLAAEFENYRKRVRGEMRDAWARAQADLVRRLVESMDDLRRVSLLDPATATVADVVQGVGMVERKMLRALDDAGLEILDPVGEDFDPTVMEAVMRAPAESEEEDDTVDLVLQRGYLLQGHLVRPARVSVRKHG